MVGKGVLGYFMVLCACFVLVCVDFFECVGFDWVYLSRLTGNWVCKVYAFM